jgi:hypothetical protein
MPHSKIKLMMTRLYLDSIENFCDIFINNKPIYKLFKGILQESDIFPLVQHELKTSIKKLNNIIHNKKPHQNNYES